MATDSSRSSPLDRARRKAYIRLLPILFVCYVIAFVDRVNVSFAKLQMQPDLAPFGFTESIFGFGMGIFFLGYLIPEIPATLMVERWSARKWICRIMVSWGLVAALTAFVRTPFQFYAARFTLGLAEAGFYPGVIVFLTHWFPRRDRTKALAWFCVGTPIAQMIGPPISDRIMAIAGFHGATIWGLVGWQWIFILWGIPAIVLGIVIFFWLADWPREAAWLTIEEREALESTLAQEKAEHLAHSQHTSVAQALANPQVIALAAAYFLVVTGSYGVEFYMASIVRDWYGFEITKIAYLIIIPPTGALLGQLLIGWSSDRWLERRWHSAGPIMFGAAALVLVPWTKGSVWLTMTLFTLALIGVKAYLPAFWALPSLFLTESAAAAGIGLINSFGNLGGWAGPSILGYVKQATREYTYGLWFLSFSALASSIVILCIGIKPQAKARISPRETEAQSA